MIATYKNKPLTAVYICPEWQIPVQDPWTLPEYIQQLKRVGYVAQPQPGIYMHSGTYKEIDINELDKNGDPDWLNWAIARMTPPPF